MGIANLRFVITGASRGIGAATARMVASRGASVVMSDVSDDVGQEVVDGIRIAGGRAMYVHCDVTSAPQVKALMEAANTEFGGIDILHNNAGIHETALITANEANLADMPIEIFRKVLEINAVAPWVCAKYALPFLKRSQNASIINAGSAGSQSAYPNNSAYGTSKGGIRLQTQNLAVELAKYRIRVNCYGPTAVATEMMDSFIKQAPDPRAFEKAILNTSLIPRMGRPNEVAELVCFLASPESSFINGAFYLIDGGSLAWRGTVDQLGFQ